MNSQQERKHISPTADGIQLRLPLLSFFNKIAPTKKWFSFHVRRQISTFENDSIEIHLACYGLCDFWMEPFRISQNSQTQTSIAMISWFKQIQWNKIPFKMVVFFKSTHFSKFVSHCMATLSQFETLYILTTFVSVLCDDVQFSAQVCQKLNDEQIEYTNSTL